MLPCSTIGHATAELNKRMQLIGYLDSPFVRRTAVSARFLGIEFEHRELSIWRDYDEFRGINPLVKVPTLVCDDGTVLVESTLIIEHFVSMSSNGVRLMPEGVAEQRQALRYVGVALVAMEKAVQLIYETDVRPAEFTHGPWRDRVVEQLMAALEIMNDAAAGTALWLFGDRISQADISTAIAWRFIRFKQFDGIDGSGYPALSEFSARAEVLPEFLAFPLSS